MRKKLYIFAIIIIILISIFIFLSKTDKLIDNKEINKEQLAQATSNNAYISMETHLLEIKEMEQNSSKPTVIGSWSDTTSITINCSSISNYQNLTTDNFFPVITQFHIGNTEWLVAEGTVSCSKSYDSSTGVLKITNLGGSAGHAYARTYGNVYLIP